MNAQSPEIFAQYQSANEALAEFETQFFDALRQKLGEKPSAAILEENQYVTHGGAWLSTYVTALRELTNWAQNLHKENRFWRG